MTTASAPLATPIDALYLIHSALRAEAARAEQTVQHLEVGSSFKAFQPVFYHWALVLSTYVEAEERVLTALVPEVADAWAATAGTARRLLERLEALQTYLQTEISKTMVIARTKRQLCGRVALARLLQEDLIEDEEACLLPVLRTRLSVARQLEVLRWLLIDLDAAPEDTVHDFPAGGWRVRELAQGVHYTIVNGQVLLEDGRHTGALPGRVLRNTLYQGGAAAS